MLINIKIYRLLMVIKIFTKHKKKEVNKNVIKMINKKEGENGLEAKRFRWLVLPTVPHGFVRIFFWNLNGSDQFKTRSKQFGFLDDFSAIRNWFDFRVTCLVAIPTSTRLL